MAIPARRRQRMINSAEPFLPGGTQIQQIFLAQTQSHWLFAGLMCLAILPGALVFMLINEYRMIAVTPDAIYILDCGHGSKPRRLLGSVPRGMRFGPVSGLTTRIEINGKRLRVLRAFYPEVIAADAGTASTAAQPQV